MTPSVGSRMKSNKRVFLGDGMNMKTESSKKRLWKESLRWFPKQCVLNIIANYFNGTWTPNPRENDLKLEFLTEQPAVKKRIQQNKQHEKWYHLNARAEIVCINTPNKWFPLENHLIILCYFINIIYNRSSYAVCLMSVNHCEDVKLPAHRHHRCAAIAAFYVWCSADVRTFYSVFFSYLI